MYYNSFQYSLRIWLTTALAVPHVYIMYFFASRGIDAYLPFGAYLVLVLESVLVSMPAWLIFWLVLDWVCRVDLAIQTKKLIAWGALETLLFLLFAVIIYGLGDRATSWSSCFEFIVIGTVAMAASVFLYKLHPIKNAAHRFNF